MSDWLEIAIAAIIIIGLATAIFRSGTANPEPTGSVVKRMSALEVEQEKLKNRLQHLEASIDKLVTNMATKSDIAHLKELMQRDERLAQKTWDAVDRMEAFFLKKGTGA